MPLVKPTEPIWKDRLQQVLGCINLLEELYKLRGDPEQKKIIYGVELGEMDTWEELHRLIYKYEHI